MTWASISPVLLHLSCGSSLEKWREDLQCTWYRRIELQHTVDSVGLVDLCSRDQWIEAPGGKSSSFGDQGCWGMHSRWVLLLEGRRATYRVLRYGQKHLLLTYQGMRRHMTTDTDLEV